MSANFGDTMKSQLLKFVEDAREKNPSMSSSDALDLALGFAGYSRSRPSAELDEASQCEANRWLGWSEEKGKYVGGIGSRCGRTKSGDGCYCKMHQKQADVSCSPCQFWTEEDKEAGLLPPKAKVGGKKGLFYGRHEDGLPFHDGKNIVIIWNGRSDILAQIHQKMEEGMIYHPFTKEGKTGKTAPPRIPGKKKTAKKSTKTKTKKTKKAKSARHRWMADGNREKVVKAIRAMHKATGKFPTATRQLLLEAGLDVELAVTNLNKFTTQQWEDFCTDNTFANKKWNIDELGNCPRTFTDDGPADGTISPLKNRMIIGEIQGMLHTIWKNLTKDQQQPYIDEEEAENQLITEATEESSPPVETKKTPVATPPPSVEEDDEDSDSDLDSDEEDEESLDCIPYEMASGDTVYLDQKTNMAYTKEGIELGQVNTENKTFI